MQFDAKQMRVRFHQLRQEVDDLQAKIAPMRDQYDKLNQDFHAKIGPLTKKIKEAEKPLFDMKNEMGMIVRALGGKTALQPGDK